MNIRLPIPILRILVSAKWRSGTAMELELKRSSFQSLYGNLQLTGPETGNTFCLTEAILPAPISGPCQLGREASPFPVVQTQAWDRDAHFSPDSKWIVFRSRASGVDEIYITPFPGPGPTRQVSRTEGSSPR